MQPCFSGARGGLRGILAAGGATWNAQIIFSMLIVNECNQFDMLAFLGNASFRCADYGEAS